MRMFYHGEYSLAVSVTIVTAAMLKKKQVHYDIRKAQEMNVVLH
jgi:hypothetical protein